MKLLKLYATQLYLMNNYISFLENTKPTEKYIDSEVIVKVLYQLKEKYNEIFTN